MFTFFTFFVLDTFSQQDPLYSQYQLNQMMINPAYAGIHNHFSASLISRAQWVGIEGAPVTNTLLMQTRINKGNVGLGAILINDRLGISDNMETYAVTSYNIQMEKAKLAIGLQGGLINYRYDLSKLTLDFVDDEHLTAALSNSSSPNFGFGLLLASPKAYFGVSIPRILNRKSVDGVKASSRYLKSFYISSGFVVEASRFVVYKFTTLLHYIERNDLFFDVGLSAFLDNKVWAGLSVRNLSHFGLFTMLEVSKNLRLGYSFEIPSSSLILRSFGTHEISITANFSIAKAHEIQPTYY